MISRGLINKTLTSSIFFAIIQELHFRLASSQNITQEPTKNLMAHISYQKKHNFSPPPPDQAILEITLTSKSTLITGLKKIVSTMNIKLIFEEPKSIPWVPYFSEVFSILPDFSLLVLLEDWMVGQDMTETLIWKLILEKSPHQKSCKLFGMVHQFLWED